MKYYFVYILASKKNGTLYIGMTNDLLTRVYEHKQKVLEEFTKKYDVNKLVYFEQTNDVAYAIARERSMKKWKREWKIKLIEEYNPDWNDLFYEHGGKELEDDKDFSPLIRVNLNKK